MKTERHGYKFTNKNNTKGGIIATVLAVFSFAMALFGIIISFQNEGNGGMIVGVFGTVSFIFSTIGEVIGLQSFREKDKFYLFSWIGTLANGVLWIAMSLVIVMGIMM